MTTETTIAKLDEQTLRDIWSILSTANPGGQVELEKNRFKVYYEKTPIGDLRSLPEYAVITDQERDACLTNNEMWELTLSTVTETRKYVASSVTALVATFRQHETIGTVAAEPNALEQLGVYLQMPYLNPSISRDAHKSFSYTINDVKNTNVSIQDYLETLGMVDEEDTSGHAVVCEGEHLWSYHIYPRTPVGFYFRAGPTLSWLLNDLPEVRPNHLLNHR